MKNFFENVPSRVAFLLGLLGAIAVAAVVGFVVLLVVVLGDGSSAKTAKTTTPTAAAPAAAGQPSAPTAITLADVSKDEHLRGDKNADVTIVEFSDLECPFCKQFHGTLQQVMADYDGQVNWVYRHFPLASLHPKAAKEAEATECAAELGGNDAFWKYVDRLFEITPANNGLDPAQLPEIAAYIGLDKTKFQSCLDSGKYTAAINDAVTAATAAGGRGTPYSIIVAGDQKVPVSGAVPYAQLKQMIDSVL